MQKNPLYNTSSISFFQYLFAIAVILVHSGRLTSYEPLHFGLKSMLGRLAVPFFIVSASFFLRQSLGNSQKMKAYLAKQLVKRLGMVWTGFLALLLYCWGLIETYSAYLDTTSLLKGYQLYSNLFFTARNGLFYTPIFIYMGYYLYDHFHAQTFKVHC